MTIIYAFLIFFILLIIFTGGFRKSIYQYKPSEVGGSLYTSGKLGPVKGREFFNNPAVSKEDPSRPSIPIKFVKDKKGLIQEMNIGGYKVPIDSIPPEINLDFKHFDKIQSVLGKQIEPMTSLPKFEKGEFNSICKVGRNIENIEMCRKAISDLKIKPSRNLKKTSAINAANQPSGCWAGMETETSQMLYGFNEANHKKKFSNYLPICLSKWNVRQNLSKNSLDVNDKNDEVFLLGSDKSNNPLNCNTDNPGEVIFTTQQNYTIKVSGFSHTRDYSGMIDTRSMTNSPKSSQFMMNGCGFLCNGQNDCDYNMKIQISNLTPDKLYQVNLWGWEDSGSRRDDVKFYIEHVETNDIKENISTKKSTLPPKKIGSYSGPLVPPYFTSKIRSSNKGIITLRYILSDNGADGTSKWHGHISLSAIQIF